MPQCKFLYAATLVAVLSGCSSPPEPVQPEWDKAPASMNTSLPHWEENGVVVPAASVTGHWSQHITNFAPDAVYPPGVWYAVVHSPNIIVNAASGAQYFAAKAWLRSHGSKAIVSFTPKSSDCLTCSVTDIYFYR